MSEDLTVDGLPFELTASQRGIWERADADLIGRAPAKTDLYIDPAADESVAVLNAPRLLGTPPPGDFQFSARVSVEFAAQYDAGVLLVWVDDGNWGKFCFEYSPAGEPMIVSVVTRGVSDDANSFTVSGHSVWMRVSRLGRVYALHASTDPPTWQFVRTFTLGDATQRHTIGFEAQSPTGDGCTVRFDDISFTSERLADLRNGT